MKKVKKVKDKAPKSPSAFKSKSIVTSKASRGFNVSKKRPPKVSTNPWY